MDQRPESFPWNTFCFVRSVPCSYFSSVLVVLPLAGCHERGRFGSKLPQRCLKSFLSDETVWNTKE